MKNNFNEFVGMYSLSKTLRFELIPQGKTLENIQKKGIIATDTARNESYKEMKKTIDEYHKDFINQALSEAKLNKLDEYYQLYNLNAEKKKDENFKKKFDDVKKELRKEIANSFKSGAVKGIFERIDKKELIKEDLENWINENNNNKYFDKDFKTFTTYFKGYHENRKNMYSDEEKSTAIAYRLINENLPKFIDNLNIFEKVKNSQVAENFEAIYKDLEAILNVNSIQDIFTLNYFNEVLTQPQIEAYNAVIGGKSENELKIKGLNEYINLFNQKQTEKSDKIPKLKPLFKQILSEKLHISFLPEAFESTDEMLTAIEKYYKNNLILCDINNNGKQLNILCEIQKILADLKEYDLAKIYLRNDTKITNISQKIFGNYNIIGEALSNYYDKIIKPDFENLYQKADEKKREKLDKKREKLDKEKEKFAKKDYIAIEELQKSIDLYIADFDNSDENKSVKERYSKTCIADYFKNHFFAETKEEKGKSFDFISNISAKYNCVKGILNISFNNSDLTMEQKYNIKLFLDSIMEMLHFVKPIYLKSDEISQKDENFYSTFDPLFEQLSLVTKLYDKVRNFVTKKPYSIEKVKLNFDCSTLMDGWDENKESSNSSILFMKGGSYYIGIMDKRNTHIFEDIEETFEENNYAKIVYKLLPGPNKMLPKVFFSKSRIDEFAPSNEILEIYEKESFKKGQEFNINDCRKLIGFFKDSIQKHSDWKKFNFVFSDTSQYNDISEFYKEISQQGYKITIKYISNKYIEQMINDGKLYLFQIYNKDFSSYSKGKPNMHTLYWKALFDEENLKNVVYKLNGQAEIFYRKASIEEKNKTTHKANKPINAKNPKTPNKTNIFEYDIVKDKRYTIEKFQFHCPITINFKANENPKVNSKVFEYLKNNPDVNIIGIDRGERHLLYISVIDQKGNVLKDKNGKSIQYTLNEIVGQYKNSKGETVDFKTPYHTLLDIKENEKAKARENWSTIENIKELKEGYISQVVHLISKLMLEYNAIVVMEDLNFGFKRGRFKVEKQVYQKFEKMLINKLNYLVFKDKAPNEIGGLYKAMQLTNQFKSFKEMGKQNGFIFYVPAWNTSKIDPTTGFVDFLKPHYKSIEDSREFINKFDSIRYNKEKDYFEFAFDYDNFTTKAEGTRTQWTVCTYDIERYAWNKSLNQNKGDYEKINVTQKIKELFTENNIEFSSGNDLKRLITNINNSKFYSKLLKYLSVTLSMRYSSSKDGKDFILSPVINSNNEFYYSENASKELPQDADANGAYHIALKGLWVLNEINNTDDFKKLRIAISNKEWLNFAQDIAKRK